MNSPGRAQEAQTGGAFTITSHCFPKFDVDHPWQSISLSAKCAMTFPSRVLNYWLFAKSIHQEVPYFNAWIPLLLHQRNTLGTEGTLKD